MPSSASGATIAPVRGQLEGDERRCRARWRPAPGARQLGGVRSEVLSVK